MSDCKDYEEVGEIQKKHSLKIEDIPYFINQNLPVDLISSKSINMFNRINIETNYLSLDPKYWEENKEYKK